MTRLIGDIAFADGADTYASATGTDASATAGGVGSSSDTAFVDGDNSTAFAGGTAENPGTFDGARIFGNDDVADAGSNAAADASNLWTDLWSALDPGSAATGSTNFLSELASLF